ncbi:unnamed protein product [Schistosoma turkestanicum]|nr:unnamed protein product [Schistosoma turkestanicum]
MEEFTTETDEETSSGFSDNTTMTPDSNDLTLIVTEYDDSDNSTDFSMEESSSETDEIISLSIRDASENSDYFGLPLPITKLNGSANLTLFNFTDPETSLFDTWIEVSDTVRMEGRSIATLVLFQPYDYQSAIFFYLLNPQPDGSAFAGIDYELDSWNLSDYKGIIIDLHRQGENPNFKLIFYGNCSEIFTCQSYESFFETSGQRQQIELPFSSFKPYFRGEPKPELPPLDITQLSRIGIQAYGGVFADKRQSGPGSIELFTISAYKEA